jgi:hypothetical protein
VQAVLREFAEGKVDVLVGTHRILSRDVIPKQLGLVVVDEEQRFGVSQKELLRALRLEVDVLSLSATPIPRTLHMSLSGLRDISIIETPPEGRRPIRTVVGELDDELIRVALEREPQPSQDHEVNGDAKDADAVGHGADVRHRIDESEPDHGEGQHGEKPQRRGTMNASHPLLLCWSCGDSD